MTLEPSRNIDLNDQILLRRAYLQLDSANGVMRFLSEHFRDKYGLTPDNQITPTGEIVSVSELQEKEKLNGSSNYGTLSGLSEISTER